MTEEKAVLRVANCSGFYGDRLSAAREIVEGGPIDVLTGDYLAELTMAILHAKRAKGEGAGYVGTFVRQMKDVLKPCVDRGIKIVANAGGLDPKGCAGAIQAIANDLQIAVNIAWIDGDDLLPRLHELKDAGEKLANIDSGLPFAGTGRTALTANAYLGSWGISEALDRGADVVICPRVTDAAVIIGPAAWRFGWKRDDYDRLAGALAAGHIIECGTQATGGNYAFFEEVPSFHNVGFPIAEIEADGSFTITKHPGTGGLVSVGTVTSQLIYEVGSPEYLNPDVTLHLDSLKLEQRGQDRVRVTGCRGSSPPPTHKVCMNLDGGHRISMEVQLTGLDIEKKAAIFSDELFANLGGRKRFGAVTELLLRTDKTDPQSNDEATATLRIIVQSDDPGLAGRFFQAKVVELALASFPGFYARPAATSSGPVIEHWPALIDSGFVTERVHVNEETIDVLPTQRFGLPRSQYGAAPPKALPPVPPGPLARVALGRVYGARSGDKGGAANLGVWARNDEAYTFLRDMLSIEQLKVLLPDMAEFEIERFELANIRALNFVINGILGNGMSSSTRTDGQAKSLGEYLRAKFVDVPMAIL